MDFRDYILGMVLWTSTERFVYPTRNVTFVPPSRCRSEQSVTRQAVITHTQSYPWGSRNRSRIFEKGVPIIGLQAKIRGGGRGGANFQPNVKKPTTWAKKGSIRIVRGI